LGKPAQRNLQETSGEEVTVSETPPAGNFGIVGSTEDTRTTKERMKDADRECWRGIEKVEAERNLRDQKRRWRRDQERIRTQAQPRKEVHWGWTLVVILAFSGIASALVGGAAYTVGSLPCDLDPQRTNAEYFNDLLDNR